LNLSQQENQKEAKPPRSKLSGKPRQRSAPAGEAKIKTWINTSRRLMTRDDQVKTECSGARTKDTTQNKNPASEPMALRPRPNDADGKPGVLRSAQKNQGPAQTRSEISTWERKSLAPGQETSPGSRPTV
jgi:hypothetical protein